MDTFERLVAGFYAGVEVDHLLRPMYPADLSGPRRHLTLFLAQYFGGPHAYSAERGQPRLRARHLPFPIDRAARDAWVQHMVTALATLELPEKERATMEGYFRDAATFLMNQSNGAETLQP